MKRRIATRLLFIGLTAIFSSACGSGQPVDNVPLSERPTPVSGITDTKAGIAVNFPEGWAAYPTLGRPYTSYFENKERQLVLGLTEFANHQSADTLGDQVKRRLAIEGTVTEYGPVTVDGAPAFRVVASLKTTTGKGLVIGTAIARKNNRGTAVYLYSAGDERDDHRAEMDALLATIKMK